MPAKTSSATVDITKTTTDTSSKPAPARRSTPLPAQPSVIQQSAAVWATMTGDQRSSYLQAASSLSDQFASKPITGNAAYSAFIQLSAANISVGKPLQPQASPFAPVQALPPVQMIATYAGGKLTITLNPTSAYPNPVAIKAARPCLAGATTYKSSAFKKIGSLPSLSGPADITTLYLAHFHIPSTGYKIAIELIGVAPGGYRTSGVYVFGIASATAAEALLHEPLAHQTEVVTLKVG